MPTTKKKAPAAAKPAATKPAAAKTASAKPAASAASKTAKASTKKKAAAPPPPVVYVSAYSIGNRVTHPVFGDGKVTAIDRDQLSIKFADSEKVVLESFVKAGPKG